ncbi:cytochrome P450 [Melanomma pulvis-pyrius CBS 109.77]|uniref:Cytochrome P450 n=1 Tax=Melanomma pulvis-pyrius CBS 109.77 TaxID=1314802 RepID=A0A6A6XXC2_9PLEO|nr:cytochrome P450 [Melanomma pulvis-pyrius CBS 109.77]
MQSRTHITHVSSRHKYFLKPTDMLALLNIHGPTITASEGPENQMYRKVAAPSFGEDTHRSVWNVSLEQAGSMLDIWEKEQGNVPHVDVYSNRFALHVLSAVFFDKTMAWGSEDNDKPPPGHALTYTDAISTAFKSNETLFMTPPLILHYSPLKLHVSAQQSYVEFKTYMSEMRDATASRLRNSSIENTAASGSLLENFVRAGTPDLWHDDLSISPAAVLGNMFIFILAGHETSANTLTHALTLLALHPSFQSRLQNELDDILGDSEPVSWSYLDHFPRLLNSCVSAKRAVPLRFVKRRIVRFSGVMRDGLI